MYELRFWNKMNENITVNGVYRFKAYSLEDIWRTARSLIQTAYENGAVEIDINNTFYPILDN